MADRRATFGPVVVLGLGAAALAAVAGSKAWAAADMGGGGALQPAVVGSADVGASPLGGALALVVLACWGVVLVTRGVFRRVVAWLSALAAVGFAVTVVASWWTLPEALAEELQRQTGTDQANISMTGWWWTAVVAAVLLVATTAAAAVLVRAWPEMGSRYDAPAGHTDGSPDAPPEDNLDIWKALDEGRDPTA